MNSNIAGTVGSFHFSRREEYTSVQANKRQLPQELCADAVFALRIVLKLDPEVIRVTFQSTDIYPSLGFRVHGV